MTQEATLTLAQATEKAEQLRQQIATAIFGQEELITETLCCFLAGGHILMTGAPGLAKTTLVRVFGQNLGLDFGRVQFTPDLLPADITGSEILNIDGASGKRNFEFSRGPIFTNLLLADEINRASPRTQSALLEAMQERSCTVSGTVHRLPNPFMVFATQNPFESEGTFPLPEAQLDRFLVHALVDYPDANAEKMILQTHAANRLAGEQRDLSAGNDKTKSLNPADVMGMMQQAHNIHIDDEIIQAINELVRSTRPTQEDCPTDLRDGIWYGAGPRAGISLISVSKAYALLQKQENVRWQHVKRMAKSVLRHRIRLTAQAARDQWNEDKIVDTLIERLEDKHRHLSKGVN